MNDRAAQRKAFKEELARLRAKEQAGTLTAAEAEALRRATTVRRRRIAASGITGVRPGGRTPLILHPWHYRLLKAALKKPFWQGAPAVEVNAPWAPCR